MYIIIVGDNYLSLQLAKNCVDKANKVIVVVEDKTRVKDFYDQQGIIFVEGKANQLDTYADLELDKCDIFVASTDKEDRSVLAAVYAKESGAKKVYVKSDNKTNAEILSKVGLYPFIPEQNYAEFFSLAVKKPTIFELAAMMRPATPSQLSFIERDIRPKSKLIGMPLSRITGDFYNAIAIYKDEVFFINQKTDIFENSTLIIAVETDKIKVLDKELKQLEKGRKTK